MHLPPPLRPSGAAAAPHAPQLWVLILFVPACFTLVMMPTAIAAATITMTFGLPLAIWLALHVDAARELPALLPRAIRFAAGVSVTGLGLVGLFAFSAALACATLAAYVVTVGLRSTWFRYPPTTAVETGAPSVTVTPDAVRQMTEAELRHAWRRSFVALQQARGLQLHAEVVQLRQLLLDEVDARHPAGLRDWIDSEAA
ncbi:MAG: hypothetical protein ABWX73_07710 [Marmoricola sp.]